MVVRTWSWRAVSLARTCQAIRPALVGILALGGAVTALGVALDVASISAPIWISSLWLCSLASITALVLADPAADLLAAVPMGRGRRTIHRLSIAAPLALVAVLSIASVPNILVSGADTAFGEMSFGGLLALVSLAVGAEAWSGSCTESAVAVVPVGVVVLSRMITPETWVGQLLASWSTHPWIVVAVASAVAVAGHQR